MLRPARRRPTDLAAAAACSPASTVNCVPVGVVQKCPRSSCLTSAWHINICRLYRLKIDLQVMEASLKVEGTEVVAVPGQVGRTLDVEGTLVFLSAQMQTFRDGEVPLVIREQQPEIVDVSAQTEIARRVLSQPLRLYVPNAGEGDPGPWNYDVQILANMLIVRRVENDGGAEIQVALDPAPLREILLGIATQVDRGSENARFYFDDATRQLALIQYAKVGRVVDTEASIVAINDALLQGEHNIALQIVEEQPAVTDTSTAEAVGYYRAGQFRNILFLWLQP